MDQLFLTRRPSFTESEAVEIAREAYAVDGTHARDLGSERDQTFLILGPGEAPVAVLKVSNAAEDPGVLDMEALAAQHAHRVDPDLGVALPWEVPGSPGEHRAPWPGEDGTHWIRAYDFIEGASRIAAVDLDDEALLGWGEATARLGRALRGFGHPRAHRVMPWDVQHALRARPLLTDVRDAETRALVARVLDRFEDVVAPAWPALRAQVVHGDLTVDNAISDARGRVVGIIDFGDMSHSALVTDLASLIDSLAGGRAGGEQLRVARLILDGYQRVTPLEADELAVVADLWAARCAVTIAISSWRAARGLEEQVFAERYNAMAAGMIETIEGVGWTAATRALGGAVREDTTPSLAARRERVFGPAFEPLSYSTPVHVADASGVWITDADGRRYLDAYNNVPCVGHGHPRVAEAIARQSRRINTHMRYLSQPAVELAERLTASCPGLDTVLFVNSGSEANDLAWRLARAATGNSGALCTSFAYHGVTEATAALSPEGWYDGHRPDHVATWEAPDAYRGEHLGTEGFAAALADLAERGQRPAATILDGVLTSDWIAEPDATYVQELVRMTREAGGLWIADEVQAGHHRTGRSLWCFERFGIEPDFVTLGKPMGNGHPVAAVITRHELTETAAKATVLFSTFGGNPVSAAAGLAVLDVLDDERVPERVERVGAALRSAIGEVAARHEALGDVRGVGMAIGIEVVRPGTREPDAESARRIRDGMRDRGVLVGTTARAGNVIKVRPPLAFTEAEVPLFAEVLDAAAT